MQPSYEKNIVTRLKGVTSLETVAQVNEWRLGDAVVVHDASTRNDNADFRILGGFFGLWHEPERGSWSGIHIIPWLGDGTIFLVHVKSPLFYYVRGAPIVHASLFKGQTRPEALAHGTPLNPGLLAMAPLDSPEVESAFMNGKALVPAEPGAQSLVEWPWRLADPTSSRRRMHDGVGASWVREAVPEQDSASNTANDAPEVAGAKPTWEESEAGVLGILTNGVRVVRARRPGLSCDEICGKLSEQMGPSKCVAKDLPSVNRCYWLEKGFACKACRDSEGPDQPAFIGLDAHRLKMPGICLRNTNPSYFQCAGKWDHAWRVCPCEVSGKS